MAYKVETVIKITYFVLDAETEETLATTTKEDMVKMIVDNYKREAIVRTFEEAIEKLVNRG